MPFVKITTILLSLLLLMSGPLCAAPTTIRFNQGTDNSALKGKACAYFKRLVEQRSGHRVRIKFVHDAALKTAQLLLDAFETDRFQMAAPDIETLAALNPRLQLFELPFLFKNAEHLHRVIDGNVGAKLLETTQQQNLIALSFWDNGLIQMAANRALLRPEDAQDLTFSVSSQVTFDQFASIGLRPQKRQPNRLYAALKAGQLDGHENTLTNFYIQGLYNVQSDITLSEHGFSGYLIVASKHFWAQFPEDLKVIVQGAMKDVAEYSREMAREADLQALKKIGTTGKTTVHRLNPEQRKLWEQIFQQRAPGSFGPVDPRLVRQTRGE